MSYTNALHFNNMDHDESFVTVFIETDGEADPTDDPDADPELRLQFTSRRPRRVFPGTRSRRSDAYLDLGTAAVFAQALDRASARSLDRKFSAVDATGRRCTLIVSTKPDRWGLHIPLNQNEPETLVMLRVKGWSHPAVLTDYELQQYYACVVEAISPVL